MLWSACDFQGLGLVEPSNEQHISAPLNSEVLI